MKNQSKFTAKIFLTDKKNSDFDTVGVFYALATTDGKPQKIDINRFFREPKSDEKGSWIEISKDEYYERKETARKLKDETLRLTTK